MKNKNKVTKQQMEQKKYEEYEANFQRDMEIIWGIIARYEGMIKELKNKIWNEFGISGEVMLNREGVILGLELYREVM